MEYIQIMRPIIQQAGDLVMSHFRQSMTIHYKNKLSLQTNVDLLCEDFLKNHLCVALPGSGFIAEESKNQEIKEYTWVIDPIDGTSNFVRGFPYFCINVALMHGHDVIAAVTYQPVTGEWFYAQKDHGAWRNDVRLHINPQNYQDAGALVVVSNAVLCQAEKLNAIKQQLKNVGHGVRFRLGGAAALDLAYAAAGCFDVVIFQNLRWWDAAAGVLLVQQAGGMVCQHDGSAVTPTFTTLIAGDPAVCQLLLPIL